MATTSCSQTSSLAPTDFRLTCSLEESNGAISVAVERCQLCGGTRMPFYCRECVRAGDFVPSKAKQSERYAEKLQRWRALKNERLKLFDRMQQSILLKKGVEDKKTEIQFAQGRVALLQEAVRNAKRQQQEDGDNQKQEREHNEVRQGKFSRHEEKKKRICRYVEQTHNNTVLHREMLMKCLKEMVTVRLDHITALVQYIFSVEEVQQIHHETESNDMAMSTVSALAEARRTSYIRGRWVYTDNGGEHLYSVVEPTLPGNGDYSPYNIWLLENKEQVPAAATGDLNQRNPAYTISAALAYTTQLVSLLAYFLDVNLPKRICYRVSLTHGIPNKTVYCKVACCVLSSDPSLHDYSDFCSGELSERQFNKLVSRLNHNVLHLCFTQNVDPELLHPKHTIHNLLLLLRAQQLGRVGSFEVNPELMLSLDEGCSAEGGSDYDYTSSEEEVGTPEFEWERVPVTLPEADLHSRGAGSYMSSTQAAAGAGSTYTSASTAGGLMQSAAASVASMLWRTATSRRQDS